ncbi:hypothetical protein NXS19_005699 [Fusarium pseudograminearum]|nr:hypothetical protein NXS19_005699 [Fusarium pseudograminearum]
MMSVVAHKVDIIFVGFLQFQLITVELPDSLPCNKSKLSDPLLDDLLNRRLGTLKQKSLRELPNRLQHIIDRASNGKGPTKLDLARTGCA